VALNGNRTPRDHPAVPVDAAAQAAGARAAVSAGAGAIHVHVCGPDGRESLAARDVARTLQVVRRACAAVPVGISTAAWIVPGEGDRLTLVEVWEILPDFVSVNFDEKGAVEVLVASSLRDRCFRILLEPLEQAVDAAPHTVAGMEASLDRAHVRQPRLLHGQDATAWHFVREAATKGYDTRVGFEDVLALPDGRSGTRQRRARRRGARSGGRRRALTAW